MVLDKDKFILVNNVYTEHCN